MKRPNKQLLVGAGVGLALMAGVVGGGVALAQTPNPSGSLAQDLLNRFAQNLGTTPERLTDAWKQAAKAEIDQMLQAGQITQAQADAMKSRIDSAQRPPLGLFGLGDDRGGRHGGPGGFLRPDPQALATWLGNGTTAQDVTTALSNGQSLAAFAQAKGKSEQDLITFLQNEANTRIDQAVQAGQLTQDQANQLKAQITTDRLKQEVEETHQPGGPPHGTMPNNGAPSSGGRSSGTSASYL